MRRFLSIALGLALGFSCFVSAQTKSEIRDLFIEAESFVLFEEYNEALPFYLDLLRLSPDNANLKFRIGQCYLNMPGEKSKALGYLEEAVQKINPKHKEGRLNEDSAPWDAWYYLANAYRITNDLDKAIVTYRKFQTNIDAAVYDTAVINLQIQSCLNAKLLMASPLYVKQVNAGSIINDRFSDFNPVLSADESTIVFTRKLPFYVGVFYSKKVNGKWSEPIDMTPQLGVDNDFYSSSLSADGNTLLLYKTDDYTGNIYVSKFVNNRWNGITKLNENVNTKYWESHASITKDGKRIYFSSNRKGGLGGLDLYYADLDTAGNWGLPINMGPEINTPYNEDTPFLSADNKTLYFSSRGHFNMGGYDIFYSSLIEKNKWSTPMNVGYPINTTDDDIFFTPIGDGHKAYIAKFDENGYGLQDIFGLEIFSDAYPRKFLVRGIVTIKDLISKIRDSVKVSALSKSDPNSLVVVYSNPATGEYQFELNQGDYQIAYEADGTKKIVSDVKLPITTPSDTFIVSKTDLEKSDFNAEMALLDYVKERTYKTGDTLDFMLQTEPRSVLRIDTYQGDSLLTSEERLILDNTASFRTTALKDESKVVFTLTDRFGNVTQSTVNVSGEPESAKVAPPVYASVIARKQVDTLLDMLIKNADPELQKVIKDSDPSDQKFSKADDLIEYIREAAAKEGIASERIDLLALKVAANENILTQAAVNTLIKHADGDILKALEGTDIQSVKLKTFNELGRYTSDKTQGEVTIGDLTGLAQYILMDPEDDIEVLKSKFRAIAKVTPYGKFVTEAILNTDLLKLKTSKEWMKSFVEKLSTSGLKDDEMAVILSAVSLFEDENAMDFINTLKPYAYGEFAAFIDGMLASGDAKTAFEVMELISMKLMDGSFTGQSAMDALTTLILIRNKPESDIVDYYTQSDKNCAWLIYVGAGTILLIILLFYRRKRKKDEENNG